MERKIDHTPIFGIVDKLSTHYGNTLAGVFVPNSCSIALHAIRPVGSERRSLLSHDQSESDPSYIHIVKPEFVYSDRILRGILVEGNTTFLTLQALNKSGTVDKRLSISEAYRSIIRTAIEKMQKAIKQEREHGKGDGNDNVSEIYQHYVSMFYSIECIWHICEIFFVAPKPGYAVVPDLLDWVRFYFPLDERSAADLLLLGSEANKDESYWPTIRGLLIQGQLDIIYTLLRLHPSVESNAFKMTEQILKAMPTYKGCHETPVDNFRSQWEYWKTDTETKLAAKMLSQEPELEFIIKLVLGHAETWNSYIPTSNCWHEYFPGFLFFTNPACKPFEVEREVKDWLHRWTKLKKSDGEGSELKHLDQLIFRVMESDLNAVIHSLQTVGDNQWFLTHLTDLLYNCGQLNMVVQPKAGEYIQLRNSLLFEFGTSLMAYGSLWQMGIDYLEQCSAEGERAIEMVLPRLPIHTQKMALTIKHILRRKGFKRAEQDLYKILSKQSFNEKRYGNALEWAVRSKDPKAATAISDFLLKNFCTTGRMLGARVILRLAGRQFISARLIFLCKYVEFYKYYGVRDFKSAAKIYMVLLESKATPEYFWPTLFLDALLLLEAKDMTLSSKEICMIMENIDRYLVPLTEKTKKLKKMDTEEVFDYRVKKGIDIVKAIRYSCIRNLARAFDLELNSKII